MPRTRFLQNSFCVLVLALAVFQLSENTADPDLWGHIVFGRAMIKNHAAPKTEIYSWTARGQPWTNHECLSEVIIATAYDEFGGSGILLLKMVIGLLTFAICLRLGGASLDWPRQYIVWAFGALAFVEISFGFSARPQIFTALCIALELAMLRRIYEGKGLWAIALPPMFIFWVNAHGGVLAGVGLLGLAAGATSVEWIFRNFIAKDKSANDEPDLKTIVALWLTLVVVIGALFINPWGAGLVQFLVKSVVWLRPEIEEWNPTPLGWAHAAVFILIALGIFAALLAKRRRILWELTVFAAFAVLALRNVRNAPLCGVVSLALMPPYLASAMERFHKHFKRLEKPFQQSEVQRKLGIICLVITAVVALATVKLHKEYPQTMSVPRGEYPVSAISFVREHDIKGKLLVFFDWGEMAIFHLPDSPPSIDPRLDTCYPRDLIAAHWKFYNGEPFDEKVFHPYEADFALLPVKLAGALSLKNQPGWKPVYYDDTAVVLVRDAERFPKLKGLALPVAGDKDASVGRAEFGVIP